MRLTNVHCTVRYSLPRWTDLTVSRQGLLDDVWKKPAVMGWMFLPMKPYHAGGDGASFEPYLFPTILDCITND
jgi:hypothetical protein